MQLIDPPNPTAAVTPPDGNRPAPGPAPKSRIEDPGLLGSTRVVFTHQTQESISEKIGQFVWKR